MKETVSSKKISLLCPSFSGGGAEKVMITLANKFSQRGYAVDFVVGRNTGPYRNDLDSKVNKIVLLNEFDKGLIKKVKATVRLIQYFRKTNARSYMSTLRKFNSYCYFCYLLSRSKGSFFVREAASINEEHFRKSIKSKILLYSMKVAYRLSSGVVANSKATKEDIIRALGVRKENIVTIYNPLDIPVKELSMSSTSRKGLLAVGRLVPSKNFSDLIDAFLIVRKKYPNVGLTILGSGPEKEYLMNKVHSLELADSVEFRGFVSNPYEFYRSAQVFVQTSLWEGFGYVLAEALAFGTPVVAYDSKGAMREILDNGKYGKLSPVGDIRALANSIIEQIESPLDSTFLKEAVEPFNVDKIVQEYLDLILLTSLN